MNLQEELTGRREKYHVSIRHLKAHQSILESRKKFIDAIERTLLPQIVISFQTALQNIKDNINISPSLYSLIHRLQEAPNPKQKYKVAMLIIDGGILHCLASVLSREKCYAEEIMTLVSLISSIEEKTGNYIIRSGVLAPILDLANFESLHYTRKLLSMLGNICSQDIENRNIIADAEVHLEIVRQIGERLDLNSTIYSNESSDEEKKIWIYRFWFLNQFYAYGVPGELVPTELVQILLRLLAPQTHYNILTRVITLLACIKVESKDLEIFAQRVDKLIGGLTPQSPFALELTYLLSQLPQLPVFNFRPLLKFFSPQYFGIRIENNDCQGFITRILYARRAQLDPIPQLHQPTFWQPIMSKSLKPFQRCMVLEILTSINLQDIEWVFEALYTTLNQNNQAIQIRAGLEFITAQIQRKGKQIVGVLIQRCGLDKLLLGLEKSKDREVYAKLKGILDLYN